MNKRILKKLSRKHQRFMNVAVEYDNNSHIVNWDELPVAFRCYVRHQAKKRERGQNYIDFKRPKLSKGDSLVLNRIVRNHSDTER